MIKPSDLTQFYEDGICWEELESKRSLSAPAYINFATEDLSDGKETRHILNAVSNAKRALHLCVEDLAEALGAYQGECEAKSPFPKKLDFRRRSGIASPKIIDRINRIRNRVEHEYYVPTLEEAEDFLDIVTLFLQSTKSFSCRFPTDVDLISPDELFGMYKSRMNIKYKVGSGILELTWFELTADKAQLQKRAAEIAAETKSAKEKKKGSPIALNEELYRKASKEFRIEEKLVVKVCDDEKYFDWMRLFLKVGQ